MLNLHHLDLATALTWIVALVIALTVHEFAHAWTADRAGDPTPRAMGRVTLNPIAHYDLIGSTMILLLGFGWGKPVPVNPAYFRRPRTDDIWVSFAGPCANFIVAVLFAMPIRFGVAGIYQGVFETIIQLNLILALFNLIPIYPLDGSHILANALPPRQGRRLQEFYARFGLILLLVIIWVRIPVIGVTIPTLIVGIPLQLILRLLVGM